MSGPDRALTARSGRAFFVGSGGGEGSVGDRPRESATVSADGRKARRDRRADIPDHQPTVTDPEGRGTCLHA